MVLPLSFSVSSVTSVVRNLVCRSDEPTQCDGRCRRGSQPLEIDVTFRCSPLLLAAMMLTPAAAQAQAENESARTPAQVSATDYARAEALIGWNARELVIDDAVNPKWMSAHSFWYRNHSPKGYEFLVVDAATGAKRPLFDPVKLASVLSQRADTAYDPELIAL